MGFRNRAVLGQLRRFSCVMVGRRITELTPPSSPPTITSSSTPSVLEGTTDVITITATDGQAPYVFSIAGGSDAAFFDIDADTGELVFAAAQDFDDPQDSNFDNTYEVVVRVASATGPHTDQSLAVLVKFDPGLLFDLYIDPSPLTCFSDTGASVPCAAGDAVLRAIDNNGGVWTVSGYTLEVEDGEWVIAGSGSGGLTKATGAAAFNQTITIGFVVRLTAPGTGVKQRIASWGDESTGESREFGSDDATAELFYIGYNVGLGSTGIMVADTWANVMYTVDAGASPTVRIYKEGSQVGSNSPPITSFSAANLYIGSYLGTAHRVTGRYRLIGIKGSVFDSTAKGKWDLWADGMAATLNGVALSSSIGAGGEIMGSSLMG